MTDIVQTSRLSRRALFKIGGGGLVAVAGAGALSTALRSPGSAQAAATPVTNPTIDRIFSLAGTDGWVYLRGDELMEGNQVVFPDPLGEDRNMYNYGFRDASRWQRILQTVDPTSAAGREAHDAIFAWKGETQNASPLLWVDEGQKVQIVLYNLGWQVRPDIPDGHTIHWHGFRNAIPWFDGVPEMAAGAPIGKTLTYFYNPVDPGTYMYHCHWEDVEHIQMGMTGIVFVNPKQNNTGITGTPASFYTPKPGEKFVFNDNNGASAYDRQFAFMLMDFNPIQHWQLAHIQQPDWSDYKPSAWAMNGRSYPDTLLPAGVTELGLEGTPVYSGTATGGTSRTISKTGLPAMPAGVSAGKIITLLSGQGAGQRREIASRTGSTITVTEPWDTYLGLPEQHHPVRGVRGREPRAPLAAAVVARHVPPGRPGAPAGREPRLPAARDAARGHRDAGRRPRLDLPRRPPLPHVADRRRAGRGLRRDLHRPGPLRRHGSRRVHVLRPQPQQRRHGRHVRRDGDRGARVPGRDRRASAGSAE